MTLPETGTPLQILTNLILWVTLIIHLKKNRFADPLPQRIQVWILILIFCLFSFWCKDYFGYLNTFYNPSPYHEHLEDFYVFLRDNTGSYLLFRLAIWGSALLQLFIVIKRMNLSESYSLFTFCNIFILWFSYGRVTLAIMTAIHALTYFTHPLEKKKIIGYILGGTLIIISSYFHRSALLIISLILAVKFIPINKKTFIIAFVSIPLLVYLINNYFMSFMLSSDNTSEMDGTLLIHYSNISGTSQGIGPVMMSFFQRFSIYAMAYYLIYEQFIKNKKIRGGAYVFFKLAILLIIVSLAFDYSDSFNKLKTRIRIMSVVPLLLSYTAHIQEYGEISFSKKINKFIVLNPLYTLIYMMYCAAIG